MRNESYFTFNKHIKIVQGTICGTRLKHIESEKKFIRKV